VVSATLVVLLPTTTADAVSSSRPIAVAVGDNGTSYVGFATGGALVRLDADGTKLSPVPLDRPGPVDGLAVGGEGNIWVDYGDSVSLLTPRGHLLTHFSHDPAGGCSEGSSPASRYGGIAVGGSNVYVAARCRPAVEVYSPGGTLRATLSLRATPRGIAWGPAQAGKPARLFVALPDRGEVLTFDAESLRDSSTPVHTLRVRKPGGGEPSEPAGVTADRYGQVVVSDVANNALYFYDANHDYTLYRTLGHPPDPDDSPGSVSSPSAIAQHDQDGGPLSGNLFVADTRNGRVQRWDTGGYTFWVKDVTTPGGVDDDRPVNLSPPEIGGTAEVGGTLSCSRGTWSGDPTSFARAWLRDGSVLAGRTGSTYDVVAADAGHALRCRVTATNRGGSASATSAAVVVDGTPPPVGCTGPVGVSIDSGAVFTTSAAVTLTIRPPAGATTALVSNDGGFDDAVSRTLDPSGCDYSWTLSAVGSERLPRIVYVRFDDDPETFTDDIVLDQVAPRLSSAVLRHRASGWRLLVRADDVTSGVATLQYAARRGGTGAVVGYRDTVRVPSSAAARWVRVADRAGNVGTWRHVG
jgi:hypothetical protein